MPGIEPATLCSVAQCFSILSERSYVAGLEGNSRLETFRVKELHSAAQYSKFGTPNSLQTRDEYSSLNALLNEFIGGRLQFVSAAVAASSVVPE